MLLLGAFFITSSSYQGQQITERYERLAIVLLFKPIRWWYQVSNKLSNHHLSNES